MTTLCSLLACMDFNSLKLTMFRALLVWIWQKSEPMQWLRAFLKDTLTNSFLLSQAQNCLLSIQYKYQMISDEILSVILDIGSLNLKAGFSGEDVPRYHSTSNIGIAPDSTFFGDESLYKPRPSLEIKPVLQNGIVPDYNHYQSLVSHSYSQLNINSADYSLLLANNFQSKTTRDKVAEIMFETFKVPNLFFVKNSILSTFSAGRQSALVLDIGAYQTQITAVFEGYALSKSSKTLPIGGETLNDLVHQEIKQKQIQLQPQYKIKKTIKENAVVCHHLSYSDKVAVEIDNTIETTASFHQFKLQELLRDIKESLIFYVDPVSSNNPLSTYELPDGNQLTLSMKSINSVSESLFNYGVHTSILDVANQQNSDLRLTLQNNILATGGATSTPGFLQRLNQSLQMNPLIKTKLIQYSSAQNKQHSVFIGGSLLGSLSSFQSLWVSQQEYYEDTSIIDKKCSM